VLARRFSKVFAPDLPLLVHLGLCSLCLVLLRRVNQPLRDEVQVGGRFILCRLCKLLERVDEGDEGGRGKGLCQQ